MVPATAELVQSPQISPFTNGTPGTAAVKRETQTIPTVFCAAASFWPYVGDGSEPALLFRAHMSPFMSGRPQKPDDDQQAAGRGPAQYRGQPARERGLQAAIADPPNRIGPDSA
jgi:hypothetical protein